MLDLINPSLVFTMEALKWSLPRQLKTLLFRSQLEYETFLENYELNQYFHLNMVGISAFQKSSECTSVLYRVVSAPHSEGSQELIALINYNLKSNIIKS